MVEIRASRQEEVPAQKQLWKLAFGDEDSYIDYFYQNYYSPENMMVLVEDGKLSTMLALFPMTLRAPEGVSARAAYVYALATDPAARKKGYGRQILHYLDFYLRQREVDCVTVVPAEPSLHKFFSSVDFDECFVTREVELLRELVEPVRVGTPSPRWRRGRTTASATGCWRGSATWPTPTRWWTTSGGCPP